MRYHLHWIIIVVGVLAIGCQSDMPEPLQENGNPWQLSYEEETLLNSSNDMSFNLLQYLDQVKKEDNIFFSPVGIGNGIGMALNVINKESELELKTFLKIDEVSNIEINKAYSKLSELFGNNKSGSYFSSANSVWLNYDYVLNKSVSNQLMAYYSADVEYLDFDKTKHLKSINQWARNRTEGEFEKVMNELNSKDKSYLINLIRLNPEWTFTAKSSPTDGIKFTTSDGTEKNVPARRLEAGQYKIFENEQFRLIDIPYGEHKFRFTLVTTKEGIDLEELNKFNREQFNKYLEESQFTLAEINLPNFKIEHELRLKEVFPELILNNDNRSNREGNDINSISEFIHKTSISVQDPEIKSSDTRKGDYETIKYNNPIYINRPFVFFIREKLTGAIVFVGKVKDPTIR